MSKFHSFLTILILKTFQASGFYKRTYKPPKTIVKYVSRAIPFETLAYLSWLVKSDPESSASKNKIDKENKILALIQQAEENIVQGKLKEAKTELTKAMKIADDNECFDKISYMCDLLSSIMLTEGDFYAAENMLVKFTERLLQLGYAESHNAIVSFKLKLARIYQLLNNVEMAEYGYRDCIQIQEKKLLDQKTLDEESNGLYLTALYWYGKLLADQKDFQRARKQLKCCWERILKTKNVLPSQKMVVLHSIANVSASLKDYDGALHYLFKAIDICIFEDPNNRDLPIFIVQVGLVLFQKEILEEAMTWCKTGHDLATTEGNKVARDEGQRCINEISKVLKATTTNGSPKKK